MHLKELITQWSANGEGPVDLSMKLELKGWSIADLVGGESTSDVVMKTFCKHQSGEDGLEVYYRTISASYGGPEKFVRLLAQL